MADDKVVVTRKFIYFFQKDRKHCKKKKGGKKKANYQESLFATMFSKGFFSGLKNFELPYKGLNPSQHHCEIYLLRGELLTHYQTTKF